MDTLKWLAKPVLGFALASFFFCPVAWAKMLPSPGYLKVWEIANSPDLSKEQKIEQLQAFALQENTRLAALSRINSLDFAQSNQLALSLFRSPDASRETKLSLGHYLMTKEHAPPAFAKEFADFLIEAILDGGEKEFCLPLPEGAHTAVGEYAYLSNGFEGYRDIDFAPFKSPRLIDPLIRCLDAPDNVWPENQGCVRLGNPGEPTGRNSGRQHIPVALARLEAIQAIEPLRRILRDHHDWYLRDNAAYSLGILENPGDHTKTIAELRTAKFLDSKGHPTQDDRFLHLFALGRGLIARGDDAGLEFFAPEFSNYHFDNSLSATSYMIEERLELLKSFKSPKLEQSFTTLFADENSAALFLFERSKIKVNNYGSDNAYDWYAAASRIEKLFDAACLIIEANHLVGLRDTLHQFAEKSDNTALRNRARRCIAVLSGNPSA